MEEGPVQNGADGAAKGPLAVGQLGFRLTELATLLAVVVAGTLWFLDIFGSVSPAGILAGKEALFVGMKPAMIITWVLWAFLLFANLYGTQIKVRERSKVYHAVAFFPLLGNAATFAAVLFASYGLLTAGAIALLIASVMYVVAYIRTHDVPIMADSGGKRVQYEPLMSYIMVIFVYGLYLGWIVYVTLASFDVVATCAGATWFTGGDTRGALALASLYTLLVVLATILLVDASTSVAVLCALLAIKGTHSNTYAVDDGTPIWFLGILTGIVAILFVRYSIARIVVTLQAQAKYERKEGRGGDCDNESAAPLVGARLAAKKRAAERW